MGCLSRQSDLQSLGGGLGQSPSIDDTLLRVSAQIVEGIYLSYSLFPDQVFAAQSSLAGLLPGLKYEIDCPVCLHLIQLQRQAAQGSAMPVMAAFMGYSFMTGMIGQGIPLLYGQGIHIGPNGDGRQASSPLLNSIEPAWLGYDLQAGVFFQEIPDQAHSFFFLHGQFRYPVKVMAEFYYLIQIVFIHIVFSSLSHDGPTIVLPCSSRLHQCLLYIVKD